MFSDKILFKQERVGRWERPMTVLKLKTMRDGERANGRDAVLARFNGDDPDSDSVTHVGALLRYLRLDEIPQIWNWVCGELNLVGIGVCLPDELNLLPDDVREFYYTHGPGLFPAEFFHDGASDKIEAIRSFMKEVKAMEDERAGIRDQVLFSVMSAMRIYWNCLKSRQSLEILWKRFSPK